MYDRVWAREVQANFRLSCTRAEQIDLCIQQIYAKKTRRNCTEKQIQDLLTDSIQGKRSPRLWRDYKRLIKKSPLDRAALEKLTGIITVEIDVENLQRQFNFS